jgi:hypothetical protein
VEVEIGTQRLGLEADGKQRFDQLEQVGPTRVLLVEEHASSSLSLNLRPHQSDQVPKKEKNYFRFHQLSPSLQLSL